MYASLKKVCTASFCFFRRLLLNNNILIWGSISPKTLIKPLKLDYEDWGCTTPKDLQRCNFYVSNS